ncbi:MAG: hypothetical protein AB7T03_04735 [Bacilli bacterium]
MIETLLKALTLTLVCELLVLMLFKVKPFILAVGGTMNIITNLTMNVLIIKINFPNYYLMVLILEIIVVIIEFGVYYLLLKKIKTAFILSLEANIVSYGMGIFLMDLIY